MSATEFAPAPSSSGHQATRFAGGTTQAVLTADGVAVGVALRGTVSVFVLVGVSVRVGDEVIVGVAVRIGVGVRVAVAEGVRVGTAHSQKRTTRLT